MADLATDYVHYTTEISSPDMAVSLETAGLLGALYARIKPPRILDLGSGFSTYVAYRYAPDADILTIDDDPNWLRRTESYIDASFGICPSSGTLEGITDCRPADVVFYDLGRMPVRRKYLAQALRLVNPGGVVIPDDLHKYPYSLEVENALQGLGDFYRLQEWTTDHLFRYSGVWIAP